MCFQFKASFSPCIIFELFRYDIGELKLQLAETIHKTPNLFTGSMVVIDMEKLKASERVNFEVLKQLFLAHGMTPVGIRGGTAEQQEDAMSAGLPLTNIGKSMVSENAKTKVAQQVSVTKLITHPIRSGMQIYAKETDLIVAAQVSPGAELMAHGNIHVYGCLRGRALAGIHGNKEARIFCRSLEAELVAVAGYYLTRDEFPAMREQNGMIQIFLKNDELQIEML
jgi:septum site-determining protein MinC